MTKRRRYGGSMDMGKLMGATLGTARIAKGVERARAILLWPTAVGSELAKITRPRSQQGGTLYVEVRDSATAHHLTMQRHRLLARLQELLGDESIRELRFSVGSIKKAPDAPRAAPLPAPDRAKARKLAQEVADPELKQVVLRAAEAITRARRWREEQGYRPCPVCGEPSAEVPCRACTLTLEDPNVRRAARSLLRAPERVALLADQIGDSGLNAARYLALEQLEDQLDLLALECVRSGSEDAYLSFLRAQAEVYLCIKLDKPRASLRRADRAQLPERVAGVLNAGRDVDG